MKRTKAQPLHTQMERRTKTPVVEKTKYNGNTESMVSTGSTLLNLAISGGRKRGGGLPGGILVEVFGPSGSGKTVLLCEIAGGIQRSGGEIMFHDPEARLNKQFARMFDLDTEDMEYSTPNTIPEVFNGVRKWAPDNDGINGVLADSLAALSTEMEMDNDDGDKMGMRRAKEFSEELRRTARIITANNLLMVCSNQVRVNVNAGPYGQKYTAPGGKAFEFYASLRMRTVVVKKITQEAKIAGKTLKRTIGITITVEIAKSSLDKPYRTAPVTILFDYGIDDIRENLKYVKQFTSNSVYMVNDTKLSNSIETAIEMVEEDDLEQELQEQVMDLWEEIEEKFESDRKKKQR